MIQAIRKYKYGIATLVLLALIPLFSACSSSGASGTEGNGNGGTAHPKVSAVDPADQASDVSAFTQLALLFDKAMKPESFVTGFQMTPAALIKSAACESLDCKKIIITFVKALDFEAVYTLTLKAGEGGVEDAEGNHLEAKHVWTFTIESFTSSFTSLVIDGNGMLDGGVPINDAGECTTIAIDEEDPDRTIHITYLSVSDRSPKHAFCPTLKDSPSGGKEPNDCGQLTNWTKELIDTSAIPPSTGHRLGRDINMDIESLGGGPGLIHVSYRDFETGVALEAHNQSEVDGLHMDDLNIIKYAQKNGTTWSTAVKIYDATDGITDTFIKVDSFGRVHIIFHAQNQRFENSILQRRSSLMYATCNPLTATGKCLAETDWIVTDVDGGSTVGENNYAQPSFLFVKDKTLHISYYANFTLRYARCIFDENDAASCTEQDPAYPGNWITVLVDDPGPTGDVGADSSIFVNGSGIQITYRDNRGSGNGTQLKYAFCDPALSADHCLASSNWTTITIDPLEGSGISTQLKIDGQNGRHVVYGDFINDHLRYAFCAELDCTNAGNWSTTIIERNAGEDNYISVGNLGGINTVYLSSRDHLTSALKFAFGPAMQ